MVRVKVDLFGKRGHTQTEVTPQGFPTRRIRTGSSDSTELLHITPNPLTPSEIRKEQVKAIIPAYKERI